MRSALLFAAAASLLAVADLSVARTRSASPATNPATDTPPATSGSATSSSSTAPGGTTAPPETAPNAPSSSATASASAGGAFTVGEPVKDNTGATIGSITDLKADSTGAQTAIIKMGDKTFQVAAANLGSSNGAAVINLSQSQINDMLNGHSSSAAPGSSAPSSSSAPPSSSMPPSSSTAPPSTP